MLSIVQHPQPLVQRLSTTLTCKPGGIVGTVGDRLKFCTLSGYLIVTFTYSLYKKLLDISKGGLVLTEFAPNTYVHIKCQCLVSELWQISTTSIEICMYI